MSFSSVFRRAAVAPVSAARAFSTTTPRPLAKITIIGNLADTPEVHSTSTGREVLRYAVASNSGPRDNRKTSWFRVTSFAEGPQRDYLMNLPKGYDDLQKQLQHVVFCADHYIVPAFTSRAMPP